MDVIMINDYIFYKDSWYKKIAHLPNAQRNILHEAASCTLPVTPILDDNEINHLLNEINNNKKKRKNKK